MAVSPVSKYFKVISVALLAGCKYVTSTVANNHDFCCAEQLSAYMITRFLSWFWRRKCRNAAATSSAPLPATASCHRTARDFLLSLREPFFTRGANVSLKTIRRDVNTAALCGSIGIKAIFIKSALHTISSSSRVRSASWRYSSRALRARAMCCVCACHTQHIAQLSCVLGCCWAGEPCCDACAPCMLHIPRHLDDSSLCVFGCPQGRPDSLMPVDLAIDGLNRFDAQSRADGLVVVRLQPNSCQEKPLQTGTSFPSIGRCHRKDF